MVLAKTEILKEIASGKLKIEPFQETALHACAYDLALSSELRIFKEHKDAVVIDETVDWTRIVDTALTKKINIKEGYILKPGEFVLGISEERIDMPDNIFGILSGRTRFARLGFIIDTANFVAPNTANRQVFEIVNIGPLALKLVPGERIAQIIFLRCEGQSPERGTCTSQHSL